MRYMVYLYGPARYGAFTTSVVEVAFWEKATRRKARLRAMRSRIAWTKGYSIQFALRLIAQDQPPLLVVDFLGEQWVATSLRWSVRLCQGHPYLELLASAHC